MQVATGTNSAKRNMLKWLDEPVSIAPLITLRVVVGAMLLFSTARFWYLGWIEDHYLQPGLHFHYYGFEWVQSPTATVLYAMHVLLMASSLFVMLGLFYRLAAVLGHQLVHLGAEVQDLAGLDLDVRGRSAPAIL